MPTALGQKPAASCARPAGMLAGHGDHSARTVGEDDENVARFGGDRRSRRLGLRPGAATGREPSNGGGAGASPARPFGLSWTILSAVSAHLARDVRFGRGASHSPSLPCPCRNRDCDQCSSAYLGDSSIDTRLAPRLLLRVGVRVTSRLAPVTSAPHSHRRGPVLDPPPGRCPRPAFSPARWPCGTRTR
jgi:hypothetical protein